MASVKKDEKGWRFRFFDSANRLLTLRPSKGAIKVCLMFLVMMVFLCRLGSAEDKKTLIETLTEEEAATLDELALADRIYAIGCLSSRKMNSRNGGRYGWDNLREGEHFVVLQDPKDQLGDAGCIHVHQIVDEKNFLGAGGNVWIEGISTRGIADDDLLKVHGIRFSCVGSKTYSTAIGGSRTVMHIVRVKLDNAVKTLRPIAEARGLRVWGEGTGDLVLAEFVGANSQELTIKTWQGNRKRISMKRVGEIDSAWIEGQKKK